MTMPPTLHERLAVVISREFRNGEVAFTGLTTGNAAAVYATGIPLAAMGLAQMLHAPDLTILLAGWMQNPDLWQLESLPSAEFLPELLDLPCEAQTRDYPGQWSMKRGDIDIGFCSGAQVDVSGSVNSVQIGRDAHPDIRLVGPILQPEHMTLFGREIIMMPRHNRQCFVETVDFVSGVGWPGGREGRRQLGLVHGGPFLVVTPLCIFEIDTEVGRLRVRSIHPGVERETVRSATGFEIGDLSHVDVTPNPTDEELALLRTRINRGGILGSEASQEK